MANVKISALPAASALALADILAGVQGGVTVKATMTQLAALLNPETIAVKAANTTRTAVTVPSADPDLVLTALAAGTYSFEGYVLYQSNATAAYKGGVLTSQALATSWYSYIIVTQTIGTTSASIVENPRTANTANNLTTDGANVNSAHIRGTLILPSATNISWQWAQTTSDPGNTVTLAGSWLKARKLS